MEQNSYGPSTPIAIVGIGCRFPQAKDADQFWTRIAHGQVAFREIPKDRWNHDIFYTTSQRDVDKTWTASGSFIDGYREFAALHYGIAPRRLEVMDPQQRLLIEATRWALMDAGYDQRAFDRSRTGVYVGISTSEFQKLTEARLVAMQMAGGDFGAAAGDDELRRALLALVERTAPIRAFTLSGSLTALDAAAVSQTFDFGGPSYTIDSACASASVAIHDAVTQLRAGAIDSAIAGGAYINLSPVNLVAFTKIGAISPNGVCRPFDHRSDGFVQSDGVGVVFLKRLEDAVAAGDRIHAVLLGSGCNNDGRGEGPMTPKAEGQIAALRAAYRDARVSPATIAYFEAHGTGTSIGDPVEVGALGSLLLETGVTEPVFLGSVKANIGHAMSAAGVAGLIKAIKILEHKSAPPQPDFEKPHPKLEFERFPLRIATESSPLTPPDGEPLRVAVSSFGFGGTNSHIVLEAPQRPLRSARVSMAVADDLEGHQVWPESVVVTSATLRDLPRFLDEIADSLEFGPSRRASLADVAYTLNARRHFERYRAVVAARTPQELITHLRATSSTLRAAEGSVVLPLSVSKRVGVYDAGEPDAPAPKLAFCFAGQGAQKVGLLRGARNRFARFRSALDRLDRAAQDILPRRLTSFVYPETDPLAPSDPEAQTEALKATEICQPAMAALGLAMADFLRSCGVEPHVTLGHSLGEFAALAHAGAFSAEAAVRLVAIRGLAMKQLAAEDPGTMAAVMGDEATVRGHIENIESVVVANINHPQQVSISGTTAGIELATQRLKAAGLDVRPLEVSHAFHSPLVEGVGPAIADALDGITLTSPHRPVASGVAPEPYGGDVSRMRETLMAHATAPVDFVGALHQARDTGAQVYLQVGAGGLLTGFARATLGRDTSTVNLASLEDDAGHGLVHGLCTLAALGVPVSLEALYEGEGRQVVSLPETPLAREEYWPIKDVPQPVATFDGVPKIDASVPTVRLSHGAETQPAPKALPAAEGLTTLFAQQTEILRLHAEILATQNRVLLGDAEAQPDLAARLKAVMTELPSVAPPEPAVGAAAEVPPAPAAAEPAAPSRTKSEPSPTAQEGRQAEEVRRRVFEIVAKVSAFPSEALRAEQRLVDELGFDSLMVADLGGALESQFPDLGGLPPSLFQLETTLDDLASHVVDTLTRTNASVPADEAVDAVPAGLFVVKAVESAGPVLPAHVPALETWLVTEDGSPLAAHIAGDLQRRGAAVVRVRFAHDGVATPARLVADAVNLWPERFVEGLPEALSDSGFNVDGFIHAAAMGLANGGSPLDPVGQLHPLAAALRPRRMAVVTTLGGRLGLTHTEEGTKHHSQVGLHGYVRSLARERATDAIRILDIDPRAGTNAAEWVVSEALSVDRTTDVGYDGRRRWVTAFEPTPLSTSPGAQPLSEQDVVLVTGGAGEIGALVSRRIAARRPKMLILVGRRSITPEIQQLLSDLRASGTATEYVSADVTDADSLRRALEPITNATGPVTVALHAAGTIDDAVAERKTTERLQQVMRVKVAGADALVAACPQLRLMVYFSSWSGRFGNAGQTDYAAANALLDHRAVLGAPGVRVLSVAWPPWSSTRMVASMPATIRNAMTQAGVTFLDDDEGVDLALGLIESDVDGSVVVARSLPTQEFRTRLCEKFDLTRHPYLDDHRLKGRAVVPLASITDLVAWAFDAPEDVAVVVEDMDLVRGVMGDDVAQVELTGRHVDGQKHADAEVRVDGRVAYRAKISTPSAPQMQVPVPDALQGTPTTVDLSLDDFYERHAFHGPMLRGIEDVEMMSDHGIVGSVTGVAITEWWSNERRMRWTIDPKVVDASFQLAAFWLVAHHGREGFPTGFDRFVLLQPFGQRPIRCTVTLDQVEGDEFKGHIHYAGPDGRTYGWMEGVRGRFASLRVERTAPTAIDVPAENYDIAQFPEIGELDQRFEMAKLIGLDNPYFHVHSGTARDTSVINGVEMLNFSSYNYLGYSGHPAVVEATQEAVSRFGTSVSASRIASGERPIHRQLEEGLARHVGTEDAIVFVSGHATNVTTVGHMFDRNDLIVHDSLIHDSVLQGIYLSGATRRPFPHNDLDALEKFLGPIRANYRRVLICAEGIYSMDGDSIDLPRLIDIKRRHRALLLVDEAHSTGVLGHAGRGVANHFEVDPNDVDIFMGTLSKSFASCGGFIAGSSALVRYLKYTAPGFVYSAGITPANAAAALKSLELMHREPENVERLRHNSRFFLDACRSRGINTGDAMGAAVVPAIIGNSLECMRLSAALATKKINVQPIVYPAVEDNAARLRFFISSTHTEAQLQYTAETLVDTLREIRQGDGAPTQPQPTSRA